MKINKEHTHNTQISQRTQYTGIFLLKTFLSRQRKFVCTSCANIFPSQRIAPEQISSCHPRTPDKRRSQEIFYCRNFLWNICSEKSSEKSPLAAYRKIISSPVFCKVRRMYVGKAGRCGGGLKRDFRFFICFRVCFDCNVRFWQGLCPIFSANCKKNAILTFDYSYWLNKCRHGMKNHS